MELNLQREFLNVRCPECFKLFAVKTADVREPKPKFQCSACEQKFWIPFADALNEESVIGFPIAAASNVSPTAELSAKPFRCPVCNHGYGAGQEECEKCGLIFAKFIERTNESDIGVTPEIREAWSDVTENYDDYATHQRFIAQCLAARNLDLALRRYSDILAANANDENARKALNEIKAITVARWESQTAKPERSTFNFKLPDIRLGNIAMVIAAFLIVVGIMAPPLRNLVGFGTAMLFSLLALRFYFRIL